MRREALITKIHELGLAKFEDEILGVSRPCLALTTVLADSPVPASESKLGGVPELPEDFAWPRSSQQIPMVFLARVAASDLQRIHPHLGDWDLLFFGEWGYAMEGCIIRVTRNTPVRPLDPPECKSDMPALNECRVEITEALSLPSANDDFEDWRYSEALRAFGKRTREIWGGYSITETPLRELVEQHYGSSTHHLARPHRIFGYPLYTQGHPAELAEQRYTSHYSHTGEPKERFTRSASRWLAVASFETDYVANLSFGDTGNCGFLVTEDNLKSGDFTAPEFYQDNC